MLWLKLSGFNAKHKVTQNVNKDQKMKFHKRTKPESN